VPAQPTFQFVENGLIGVDAGAAGNADQPSLTGPHSRDQIAPVQADSAGPEVSAESPKHREGLDGGERLELC
jgi:hypothetical protein